MLIFYLVLQFNTHKKFDASPQSAIHVTQETGYSAAIEEDFEFYADHLSKLYYSFEPKRSKYRTSTQGGVQFLSSKGGSFHSILSQRLDFPELGSWLENIKENSFSTSKTIPDLDRFFLSLMIQNTGIRNLRAELQGNLRNFLFASKTQDKTAGFENYFLLDIHFSIEKQRQIRRLSRSFSRQELPLLINDARNHLLRQDEVDKLFLSPWPAPRGKVSVLWSEKSLGDWVFLLLKLLQYHSKNSQALDALQKYFPSPSFHVIDNWKPLLGFDARGNKREELLLVSPQGPVLPFSANKGFFRRASFQHPAIIAPWQPALCGTSQTKNPEAEMKEGISISDFELLDFDKESGLAELRINRAYLVHDGKEGDPIESTSWKVSIFDIFSSLELFSDELRSHPKEWKEEGQTLFVEINTPRGLSKGLDFPGSVPPTHYW